MFLLAGGQQTELPCVSDRLRLCPQALGMLFWHKHNIEKSLADLPNFTPFPDEWTVEDRVLFEQAFSFHGKSFHRIQQMVHFQQSQFVFFFKPCDQIDNPE